MLTLPAQYNIAVFIFYVPYCLLDLPSNLLLRRWRPAPMLSLMMFCWGVATLGQGLTRSWAGLVACRVLMGACEAGFVPGCAYLISLYYKRHEFLLRYAVFFSTGIIAAAIGGFLAFLLQKLDGRGGYEGWRWIFIVEGLLSCVVAAVAFFLIVPWPQDCTFLRPDEKAMLLRRLEADAPPGQVDHGSWPALRACLADWKIWLATLAYFGADNTVGVSAAYGPALIQSFGHSASASQLLTIAVCVFAFVCSLTTSYFSDRTASRYPFCMLAIAMGVVGWGLLLAPNVSGGVHFFSLFLIFAGSCMLLPLMVAWLLNNLGGSFKRGVGTGIIIGGGNLAQFAGTNSFLPQEAPVWRTAYSVCLGLVLLSGLACTVMFFLLWRENRRKDRKGMSDWDHFTAEQKVHLGENHPAFRYTL